MTYLGTVLNNRYRLDQKIGEGGFAQVYMGLDLVLGRTVAVKLMESSLASDKELLGRFQLEARSVAALDHPNILTVHDFGLLPDTAFLVMPYIPGGPLSAKMRANRLTLDETGQYLEQISSALDYAHSKGIIHRDIKPQNILLRSDGRAVLTDFGFAKLLADATAEAQTRALGTVHYVAPEQIQGKVSAPTDQYSLGVMLFQMISNLLPFNGSPQEILIGHVKKLPPSLATLPTMQGFQPDIIQRLDQVLARALAKIPSMRFPNCLALHAAFIAALQPGGYYRGVAFEERTVLEPARPVQPVQPVPPLIQPSYPPQSPPFQGQPGAQYSVPPRPQAYPQPAPQPVSTARPAERPTEDEATEIYNPVAVRLQAQAAQPQPARPPVMVQPARLTVRAEPDQRVNLTFDLTGETITLGRELDNNLHIPLATISRHHAILHRIGPAGPSMKYRIVDNNSRNQLAFQGQQIKEKILENGDVIEIGKRGFGEYVVYLTYTSPVFR